MDKHQPTTRRIIHCFWSLADTRESGVEGGGALTGAGTHCPVDSTLDALDVGELLFVESEAVGACHNSDGANLSSDCVTFRSAKLTSPCWRMASFLALSASQTANISRASDPKRVGGGGAARCR